MKKLILRAFLFLIIISSFLNATPHLILNFDINKTIIATDTVNNKTVEETLNELLALTYWDCWDSTIQNPISFANYVKEYLVPGYDHNPQIQSLRRLHLSHFLDYLKKNSHPYYEVAHKEYQEALVSLKESKTQVFPSFYLLLDHLDKNQISYTIIFRSFGNEISLVTNEVNNTYKTMFHRTAKFREGKLGFDDAETWIESPQEIYQALLKHTHLAIHDDWFYWNKHDRSASKGKPFLIERDDPAVLSIFFDDNICNHTETNIITPYDVAKKEFIPINELIESGHAICVDTLQAINNKNYFIDLLHQTLEKNCSLKEVVQAQINL